MKSFKRPLMWIGIILATPVMVVCLINIWLVWTTGSRLEGQLAAIRQAGQPLRPAHLTSKPVSAEQNAATYLRQAEKSMDAVLTALRPYFVWSRANGTILGQQEPKLPLELQQTVQAAFDAHPELFALMEQAAACPIYDAQLDYSRPFVDMIDEQWSPAIQTLRELGHLLEARASWLSSAGDYDSAVQTALVLFRLGHHADRNPMLTGYLMAILVRGFALSAANTALQAGPVSRDVRDALDAELARHESMDGYEWAVQTERVFLLDAFPTPLADRDARNFWLFSRAYWNRQESECLEAMREYVALTRDPRPYRETELALRTAYDRCFEKTGELGKTWLPAATETHASVARVRAYIRCLRVLNSLQTHVPPESNEPPKLTELGLPAETTTDPFTGEPLHVEKTPHGWLIYSVGKNLRDDGGTPGVSSDGDVVVGSRTLTPAERETPPAQNGDRP